MVERDQDVCPRRVALLQETSKKTISPDRYVLSPLAGNLHPSICYLAASPTSPKGAQKAG